MVNLKTAVIGVGHLGRFHAQKYAFLQGSQLLGVIDIDEKRAQDAMDRARERINNRDTDLDFERAVQALRRSQVRFQTARRRRTAVRSGSDGADPRPN